MRGIEVVPSAKRLMTSLRNLGYDLPQAVADIVDNSIAAGAKTIHIDTQFNGDDSWLRISDDGSGMSNPQLLEAMRYGSDRDYTAESDLGKFGLGMKTASLSQCQRLTVASRSSPGKAVIGYSWDLDHIQKTNRWEILPLTVTSVISEKLQNAKGTVILWERLDRILGYTHPYGEPQRLQLNKISREIEEHLAMVFHKFLSGQLDRPKLKIVLNSATLEAWDPYCRNQHYTTQCATSTYSIVHEGQSGVILMEPFVLPNMDDFNTPAEHKKAAGPKKWNSQQGFYFYRMDRMIQSGGWSGLRTKDEHIKLARIGIRFSKELDDAFKINVAKMRVQLPQQLKDKIEKEVQAVTKAARERYARAGKSRRPTTPPTSSGSGSAPTARPISVPVLTLDQWATRLLAVTTPAELSAVQAALKRLKSR